MSERPAVTYARDADGVGCITFDDPRGRANVFTDGPDGTLAAFSRALDAAEADAPRAIVVRSAKDRIFIAGADLHQLAALSDVAAATASARRGQLLFQRVAEFRCPIVAAIHGACAGGGFELALACHGRVASEAAVTRLGLPETTLGTIPGWGGTVRLPRLVGTRAAAEHIVKGTLISAAEARRAGWLNAVVAEATLEARARALALQLADEGLPIAPPRPAPASAGIAELRTAVAAKNRGHVPALSAALDAIEEGVSLSIADALVAEARRFGEVTAGPVCKNLIHVFFLREAAKKRTLAGWFPSRASAAQTRSEGSLSAAASRSIQRVGVVGAGVMGTGVAQALAAQGFEVVLRDVDAGALERGMATVRALFDQAVKRGTATGGEANAALQRIVTTTAWDGFDKVDLALEAIVEDAAAKQAVLAELARVVPADALVASNTSALPIEGLMADVAQPGRTLGLHFFNPVGRMPLVEIVLARATAAAAAERALAWVLQLGKTPVICRSSHGFLVTRVLFFYLNAAVRRWEEGIPTSVIDDAMRDFGWPMGPLRLIDEVGLDVTASIFTGLEHAFPQRFRATRACSRLLAAGFRGRKNGASTGFYDYAGEERPNDPVTRPLVSSPTDLPADAARAEAAAPQSTAPIAHAVARGEHASIQRPSTAEATAAEASATEATAIFANEATVIAAELMAVMVDEARRCLAEGVVKAADDVDFALLTGAGFPAFRGGLLRWAAAARAAEPAH